MVKVISKENRLSSQRSPQLPTTSLQWVGAPKHLHKAKSVNIVAWKEVGNLNLVFLKYKFDISDLTNDS